MSPNLVLLVPSAVIIDPYSHPANLMVLLQESKEKVGGIFLFRVDGMVLLP